MYLLLPFVAAAAFALGSMVYKRAYAEGAGVSHVLVFNNALLAVVFLPLLWLDSKPVPWELWHQPVVTAAAFGCGHLLNVLSLRIGDVSVATPLLGAKVIFIGLVAWLVFGVHVTANQWVASALATAGVVVMGLTDLRPGRRRGLTTVLALGCAAAFALTDLFIQNWGSNFGTLHFLALLFPAVAVFSVAALPFLGGRGSLRAPRKAWGWVLAGVALSGIQAILVTGTIAHWRDAAGVNVVYATRGLWSIALVWFAGHWLRNTERQESGPRTMAFRAAGAALLLAAVAVTTHETAHRRNSSGSTTHDSTTPTNIQPEAP